MTLRNDHKPTETVTINNWKIELHHHTKSGEGGIHGWVEQKKGMHTYSFGYTGRSLSWDKPEAVPQYVKDKIWSMMRKYLR